MKAVFDTQINLPARTRQKLHAILNQALADLFDLASQTKQAHWNVKGRLFFPLHKLFDELADTVDGHLDSLAERVTTLGGVARGTVRDAAANSVLPEFPTDKDGELAYVRALINRYAAVANSVRKGIDDSAKLGDADTADLLTGISRDLDKSLWFLEAHLR